MKIYPENYKYKTRNKKKEEKETKRVIGSILIYYIIIGIIFGLI